MRVIASIEDPLVIGKILKRSVSVPGNCVDGEMSSGFWEIMLFRARGKAVTRS